MNTELRIVIGSDHKGVDLKEAAIEILTGWGYQVEDVGPATKESCNYAEYANKVCKRVVDGRADRGMLICFSGLGMSIAANRWKGVRATLARTPQEAAFARHHNNSNVLCLGARMISYEKALELTKVILSTEFDGGRHQRRVDMLDKLL